MRLVVVMLGIFPRRLAEECTINDRGKVRRIEVSALTKPEDAFAHADVSRLSGPEFDRWYCTPYASSIAYQIRQVIPGRFSMNIVVFFRTTVPHYPL